jgi:acyl-CoA synthetase (NDP forming)
MFAESETFNKIDVLFRPRSVAVVGVSDKITNVGKGFLDTQRTMGYQGKLYAVTPNKKIKDFETYPSVSAIPGPVDHVIIAVPASVVPSVIEDCVKKGVRSVAIFTAGFSEWDAEEGQDVEDRIVRKAREGGVRLLGPNCMGFFCPETGLGFRSDMPAAKGGRISLISQSGGIFNSLCFLANEKGTPLAKAISYGNGCDLGPDELLHYLAEDPATEIICLYIEGTRDGNALREALTFAASRKPVLVLKGGRTSSGARAVQSHTGSLSGHYRTWESLCRQSGAILVEDLEEMMDTARLLLLSPRPQNRDVILMSISGGYSVLFTDVLAEAGFAVPELSEEAQQDLGKLIHYPGTSIKNPLDLAQSFFFINKYPSLFQRLSEEDDMGVYIMVLVMEYLTLDSGIGVELGPLILDALIQAFKKIDKTVVIVFPETADSQARLTMIKRITEAGYPVFDSMKRCAIALNNVIPN